MWSIYKIQKHKFQIERGFKKSQKTEIKLFQIWLPLEQQPHAWQAMHSSQAITWHQVSNPAPPMTAKCRLSFPKCVSWRLSAQLLLQTSICQLYPSSSLFSIETRTNAKIWVTYSTNFNALNEISKILHLETNFIAMNKTITLHSNK